MDDQDKAVAYTLHERTVCQKCGTNPEDWLEEDGSEKDDPPYKLASRYCPGCATLEAGRDAVPKDRKSLVTLYLTKAGAPRVRRSGRGRSQG